jgi:hypothetical protein
MYVMLVAGSTAGPGPAAISGWAAGKDSATWRRRKFIMCTLQIVLTRCLGPCM